MWRRCVSGGVVTLLLLAVACGGRSIRRGDGGGEAGGSPEGGGVGGRTGGTGGTGVGATGGTGGTGLGGTGVGATGGSAAGVPSRPPTVCELDGRTLQVGDIVEDVPTCRSCICRESGEVACSHCDATCRVSSTTLAAGDSVLMPDGCTTCLCTVYGVDCNGGACALSDPCRDLATEYEIAVGALRWCGPQADNYTCLNAQTVPETIPCGCEVAVRDSRTYTDLADSYYAMGCPVPPTCENFCSQPGHPYRCGEAGFCIGSS
jgi:hypothetical protein